MIIKEKFDQFFSKYKKQFSHRWKKESFKWKNVKTFQENWNWDEPNFAEMLEVCTNTPLLVSNHRFTNRMIVEMAKYDPERVKEMFINLFDESLPLYTRFKQFQNSAERILAEANNPNWINHYQDFAGISTYLWLKYPEKYYVYKPRIALSVSTSITDSKIKAIGNEESLLASLSMYQDISSLISQDIDFIEKVQKLYGAEDYSDPKCTVLTVDFCFYIRKQVTNKDETDEEEQEEDEKGHVNNPIEYDISSAWITPANIDYFDFRKCLLDNGFIDWDYNSMMKSAKEGETVFIYGSGKLRCIEFQCVITSTDLPRDKWIDETVYCKTQSALEKSKNATKKIRFSLVRSCNSSLLGLEYLRQKDYKPTQSPVHMGESLLQYVLSIFNQGSPKPHLKEDDDLYTKDDFLKDIYTDDKDLPDRIISLLKYKKNLILPGPPGTGKTYQAKRIAYYLLEKKDETHIFTVQFHQSYSYEDFVLGYRPVKDGFKVKKGIFYQIVDKAKADPTGKYILIIDEINRGNMEKIFGELFMLIENNYRGINNKVILPYHLEDETADDSFYIPENIYIIGTMNTADRSLKEMDHAFQRRFCFVDVDSAIGKKCFMDDMKKLNSVTLNRILEKINEMNNEGPNSIRQSMGRGYVLGHSYFCNISPEHVESEVKSIMDFEIIPIINEYWYDREDLFQQWSKELKEIYNAQS